MNFPQAQDSAMVRWFFNHLKSIKGKNLNPIYVFWMNNSHPELHFISALLKSEFFPDKLWFGMEFGAEGTVAYKSAQKDLKGSSFKQNILGNEAEFKFQHCDQKQRIIIFVADYPYELDLTNFVKVLQYTLENLRNS